MRLPTLALGGHPLAIQALSWASPRSYPGPTFVLWPGCS